MAVGDMHDIYNVSLTTSALQETHEIYDQYKDEWIFLQAAYNGAKELVAFGAIIQHERESNVNYNRRINEAYGFSYSRSIVDLFNFYLFKENVKRDLGKFADDPLWQMFVKDCNLDSDEFDDFLLMAGKVSSIQGQCGILVDKPHKIVDTRGQEIEGEIYPYVSLYKSLAILDWEYDKDEYGKPKLVYLKLRDDDDLYRIWTPTMWQIWREPDLDKSTSATSYTGFGPRVSPTSSEAKYLNLKGDSKGQAELVVEAEHKLGEIPWVWIYNAKTGKRGLGFSDITDIARIDTSIMRNLSEIEEVITFGAFPMMRKPYKSQGQSSVQGDEVGIQAILEFDPEYPESKPDWLDAAVAEPVAAILDVISKKVEEIYRSANVGGMASMEISTQAKSGTALKAEFQLLNAKLVAKGLLLEKAEREIIRLWLKWDNRESMMKNITIERAGTYEVENLAQSLENILTAKSIVTSSDTFKKEIEKRAARLIITGEDDNFFNKIDKEIDTYEPPEFEYNPPEEEKEGTGFEESKEKTGFEESKSPITRVK